MVASDTLVGLVGAGILLVALVGVFVVESKDTSTQRDLDAAPFSVHALGDVALKPAGSAAPVVPCNPALPATCTAPYTGWNVTIASLPELEGLSYVAFLTKGGSGPITLGALQKTGDAFTTSGHKEEPHTDYDTLLVTLEADANANAPSSLELYRKAVSGPSTTFEDHVTVQLANADAKGNVLFAPVDSGLQVDVTLSGATNHTGFSYRAWLEGTDGKYTYVGEFPTQGSQGEKTASRGVSHGELSDYRRLVVTLENPGASTADGKAHVGFPLLAAFTIVEPAPNVP